MTGSNTAGSNTSENTRPVPTAEATITTTNGATAIDMTDLHTRRYVQLAAVKQALSIEVRTGLTMSRGRPPLLVAQEMGVTSKRTKKGALADVEAELTRMLAEKAAVVEANRAAVGDIG